MIRVWRGSKEEGEKGRIKQAEKEERIKSEQREVKTMIIIGKEVNGKEKLKNRKGKNEKRENTWKKMVKILIKKRKKYMKPKFL